MKILLLTLVFGIIGSVLYAQDFDHYQHLKSNGTIPADFILPSSVKYHDQIAQIGKDVKSNDRKTQEEFYLESNFAVDDLLQSGLVMFNDSISNYLSSVLDIVLKDDPDLRSKLRIYSVRSDAVNAFTTQQGIILVTVGMLAQLENEAQLAFVLCHEITHYVNKHSLNFYMENERIDRTNENSVYRKSSFDAKLLRKSNYSKELEIDADKEGTARYLKLGYDLKSINGVFDVLLYSYLPFDEVKFEKSFFEKPYFVFPEKYVMPEVKAIQTADDIEKENDSVSTHPNISKRRSIVSTLIEGESNDGRALFHLSKERFERMQKTARFELPLISLQNEDFLMAIYNCYLLTKDYQDNFYVKKCLAQSLYYLSKYNNGSVSYNTESDMEGEMSGLVYFFRKMSDKELNVLAVQYDWDLFLQYPEDPELKKIAEDGMVELVSHYYHDITAFHKEAFNPADTMEVKNDSVLKSMTKVEKIEKKKKTVLSNFETYAFVDLLKQTPFTAYYDSAITISDQRKKDDDYYSTAEGQKEWEKHLKQVQRKGYELGIAKAIIVNPFYMRVDARHNYKIDYIESEEKQQEYKNLIKEIAPKIDLDLSFLDIENLSADESDKFNDIHALDDWFMEEVDYRDMTLTPGIHQEEIDAIAEKYGTRYFIWTGNITMNVRSDDYWAPLIYSCVFPPLLLYAFYKMADPDYRSLFYMVIYDVKTGKTNTLKYDYFKGKMPVYKIKAHLYDGLKNLGN